MNRVGLVMSVLVPVVIAGGFLFRSAASHADAGGSLGDWPSVGDGAPILLAQADPWAGGAGGGGGAPPRHRDQNHNRKGVSVRFHDGKLELDGVQEMVQDQLERVDEIVDGIEDLPPGARARIKAHVRAARSRIKGQLKQLKAIDIDQIGPAMERLGDEIEREMESLDKELSQFGEQYGKSLEKWGKDFAKNLNIPSPPIPAIPAIPAPPGSPVPPAPPAPPAPAVHLGGDNSDEADEDTEDHDGDHDKAAAVVDPAVDPSTLADVKDVALSADQRSKLAQLRADADAAIANAKRDLDEMSTQLQSSLGNARANEADIAAQIDRISAKEAEIRKARILAWVRARSLLTADQRKRVEAAAKKSR